MRKIIIGVLALLFLLTLASCGSKVEPTVSSPADVEGKTIGYVENTLAEEYVKSAYGGSSVIKGYSSPGAAAGDLSSGALDCIISDSQLASSITDSGSGIKALNDPIAELDIGFMCSGARGDLAHVLSGAITAIEENGTAERIIRNYTGGGDYIYQPAGNSYETQLKVGVCLTEPPYCYYNEEGLLTGLETDITRAVFDYLGLGAQLIIIDRDSAVQAVMTGEVDVAIGGFFPTETTSQFVTFSEPYYQSRQVVITRR